MFWEAALDKKVPQACLGLIWQVLSYDFQEWCWSIIIQMFGVLRSTEKLCWAAWLSRTV